VKTDAEGVAKALEEAGKVDEIEANLKPLTALVFERDLMLKVMDQVNPNIPANGDPATKPDEKIWVVDWKFEERDRTPPTAPTPGKEPVHLLPAVKVLVSTLEVVITKRANGDLARNFIIRNLLNYNPGAKAPVAAGKPCVIKNEHWELSEGQGTTGLWRLEEDANDLVWPVPKGFAAKPADSDPPPPKNYWRYRVTLEIPVGAEARKAAPAAAGAEKK
jgi:hypothetical protein